VPEGSRFCPHCGGTLPFDSIDPTRTSAPLAKGPGASAAVPLDEGRFLPGTVLAGRYRIYGLLGRGGMGEVYRADDLRLGQAVALKFLPHAVEGDEARRTRFLNEVKIARQISHTNVCRVYDVSDVDGRHFLSMEYVDGEDLAALLRRIGRLPKEEAVQIARQLCAGLAAAHEQGVLHRDLKPANVMIDGRGRAKITDFGLAVLSGDPEDGEHGAGTPAYMAPEQLAGGSATTKSDLYALGLVLYELFTGHQAYDAAEASALARARHEPTPTSPSSHVEGFDPAVERVILRCLRKDPRERPVSALAVSAALPGGDPLAAALAAGETPSPELVAEAGKVGGLRPAVAWACSTMVLAGLVLIVLMSARTQLVRLVPLDKPPEVLKDRALTIIEGLGYTGSPADSAIGWMADRSYLDWVLRNDRSSGRWDRLSKASPAAMAFWYRRSPSELRQFDRLAANLSVADPPATEPGMITVILDTHGRLVKLLAVPDERGSESGDVAEPDWPRLLKEAGFDVATLKSVDPEWNPEVWADRRAAWAGVYADAPEFPIRIEAAAYRGRPVSLRIIHPWTAPAEAGVETTSLVTSVTSAIFLCLVVAIIAGGIVLGRRNLRLGRGDRKGARRLATIVLIAGCLGGMLLGHHVASFTEVGRILSLSSLPLLLASMVWIFYLAVEPDVRRLWPQMIVSWVRLLDGRVRDPLVGREVVIGVLSGLAFRLNDQLYQLISESLGMASRISDLNAGPPIEQSLQSLSGMRQAVGNLAAIIVAALLISLGSIVLLVLCRVITRRQWLGIALFVILSNIANIPGDVDPRAYIPWGFVTTALILIVIFRFGVLTTVVANLAYILLSGYPMTFSPASWYFGRTLLAIAVVGAMTAYGIKIASAGGSVVRWGEGDA
jgi:serine/threonine-protein kinase